MSGTNHIRAIAGFYFLVGAIGILSAITLLIFGKSPNIVTTLSSVAYAIGAYYFSKGSNAAKIFLTEMSSVDGSRIARGNSLFWRIGRVQSSVRPVHAAVRSCWP